MLSSVLARKTAIVTMVIFFWFALGLEALPGGSAQEDPLTKARKLIRDGDYEGAIKLLEDYISKIRVIAEQKKNVAEAYYIIAKTYYIVGEQDNSDANLRRVFETFPAFAIDEPDRAFMARVENVKSVVLAEQKAKAVEKPLVEEKGPEKEQPTAMGKAGEVKKRKFPWLIVGGVVVAAGVAAVLLLKKKTGSQNGAISISSSPTGAKVYLDGTDTGQSTNCTLGNINPGSHSIKLVKEGYKDYELSLTVLSGQTVSVNASLSQNTITVTSPTNTSEWSKGFENEIKWTTDASIKSAFRTNESALIQRVVPFSVVPRDLNKAELPPIPGANSEKNRGGVGKTPNNPSETKMSSEEPGQNAKGQHGSLGGRLGGNVASCLSQSESNPLNSRSLRSRLAITNVDIELYKGGTKVQSIASNQPNNGSYRWVPADSLADGTDYRIRISCSAESSIYGESDYFKILVHAYAFLGKWGNYGSGNGQFKTPIGIAVDNSSNIYVIDLDNNRLEKFTSDGGYIFQWGSSGSGDGQFSQPRVPALDNSGNVFVTDYGNHRIQKFTISGVFVSKWGSLGSGDGQFQSPGAIAVDSSGNVYVGDTPNHRIQKFTGDGTFVTKWGSQGSGDGQFMNTSGIAVDSSGNIYVTDSGNSRVQKFTSSGAFVAKWGSQGSGDGQFNMPAGVAVDTAGNVYVVDNSNHRIQKFTPDGVFITKWGSQGSGDGQFNLPNGVAVDKSGNVYVADTDNYRVQKFR